MKDNKTNQKWHSYTHQIALTIIIIIIIIIYLFYNNKIHKLFSEKLMKMLKVAPISHG